MSFSEKLQKLRKANKLSQEGLADLLDVTRQSVSKWESGQTYPEMDKLLAMCKIFKCSLDDLTNDEITDISIEERKKSNFNTFIDSILSFINQTYHIVRKMTGKEMIKCICTMFLVAIGLLVFRIPVEFLMSSIDVIFYQFNNSFLHFIVSILNLFIDCCYILCFILLFTYIFKIVYLDNEKYLNRVDRKKEEKINELEKNEQFEYVSPIEYKKQRKIINTGDTIFKILESAILFFIKLLSFIFSVPLLVFLFFLCSGFLIIIYLVSKKVFFLSLLIGIPFAILFLLVILTIIYSFILGRKKNDKKILILFFISIIGLGSSFGIFLLDITSIQFIDELPNNIKMTTETKMYEMTNDLYFLFQADEYIEDDAMNNQIKVEVDYYGDYVDIMLPPEIYSSMIGYVKSDNVIFKNLMNQIIQDLGNKKIYNYEKVREMNIKIYGSKENIQKLENNYEKEIHKINERNEDELEYYQNEIYRYELKIDELEEKINDLEHKIQELEHSNKEYKQKIEDYKDRLQSIITE